MPAVALPNFFSFPLLSRLPHSCCGSATPNCHARLSFQALLLKGGEEMNNTCFPNFLGEKGALEYM